MNHKQLISNELAVLLIAITLGLSGCRGWGETKSSEPFGKMSLGSQSTVANDRTSNRESSTDQVVRFQGPDAMVASTDIISSSGLPIDFPTVLQIAGADNWNVKIARQRVSEASANYCAAKSAWLPSLTVSLGYNNHEGEIQGTDGNVISVSRNSLFMGAGAGIANAPLNGGSGGPPRMFVDFSIADAIFKPLAARRLLGAEESRQNRVFNDTMLKASLAYFDLSRAQSQLRIVQTNLSEAEKLAQLTGAFVESGKGTAADDSRIAVIVNNRRQQLMTAQAELKVASTKLATVLQLDPSKLDPQTGLVALDTEPVAINLVDLNVGVANMIQQAQSLSCEISEANSIARAAAADSQAEQWRPYLPNLYLGYSGGLFGGQPGGGITDLAGRSDLDMVVSWQVENLGFGSRAKQDAVRSRTYQRNFEARRMSDEIAEMVSVAFHRTQQFQSTIDFQRVNIDEAGSGLQRNLDAISALEGMPLEAISSLEQLAQSRLEYLASVTSFNQWQIRLLRATGQSLAGDGGSVVNCTQCGDACELTCSRCITRPKRR